MKIKFEQYEPTRIRSGGDPIITVLSKAGFGFSSSFIKKNTPDKPKFISLNYSQDMDYIYVGFLFNSKPVKGALKMSYSKGQNGVIQTIGFFKKYGIKPGKFKGKYDPFEYNDEELGKLYVIKLKK